jgi:hypothetical protein
LSRSGYTHGVDRGGEPLEPLPSREEILRTMPENTWMRAQQIAYRLDVQGSRRLGTKASKGNWSGAMKAGVRLTHRLTAMYRQGLVDRRYDREYGDTWEFRRPREGEVLTPPPPPKRRPRRVVERQPKRLKPLP